MLRFSQRKYNEKAGAVLLEYLDRVVWVFEPEKNRLVPNIVGI